MIHGGGRARLRSGVQYVAYNLVGSTLFLFALATIYSVAGTLNMADLAERIAALPEGEAAILRVAGVLLLVVFAIKGALVPFQFWLPGTYASAPGPVAALFAVMTKVGAYAVIRVFSLIFPPETPATGAFFSELLLPAALVTLALGAVGVLGAASLGRLVAFGAIARWARSSPRSRASRPRRPPRRCSTSCIRRWRRRSCSSWPISCWPGAAAKT